MDSASLQKHLSQISTQWTLLADAHDPVQESGNALAKIVARYQTAVYRYLLASVRDPEAADELFQEFALRLVRGEFGKADAQRGRFRDYVKTALINLVINYHKKKNRQPVPIADEAEVAAEAREDFDSDKEFLEDWRKALLDRAWESLAATQDAKGPPFYAALRFRSEHPELSGAELTARLVAELKPAEPFTEAGLRKILQRAREKFTDLLVDEVARSLQTSSVEDIEQELIDLGLQLYCRKALDRRRRRI